MNAKTSCFNKKIYLKTLLQGLPFALLLTGIMLLFFIACLNNQRSVFEYEVIPQAARNLTMQNVLYSYSSLGFIKALLACYSFLCGILAFRYLYSKKICGTIHSLPLTRTCLYVSNCLSGLSLLALPVLVTAIVVSVYMLAFGYGISHIPLWIAVMIGFCLLFYALSVLTVMLTGHLIATPFLYGFLNFGFLIAEELFQIFVSVFFFGVTSNTDITNHIIMTPFVCLLYRLHETGSSTIGFRKSGLHTLLIYAVVAVVVLILGCFIYRHRRLETQGDPIVIKKLQPVLCYVTTAIGAACMSGILYSIFCNNWYGYYTNTKSIAILIIFFLISSVLLYFILNMLLRKTIKIFNSKHKGLIIYIGCSLLVFLLLRLDILNIENKVPDVAEVDSVYLYYGWDPNLFNSKEEISDITKLHKELIRQKNNIIEASSRETTTDYTQTIQLVYRLKNGKTLRRHYYICIDTSSENAVCSLDKDWYQFVFSTEHMVHELKTARTYLEHVSIIVNHPAEEIMEDETATVADDETTDSDTSDTTDYFTISSKDYPALIRAMEADIKNGVLKPDAYYNHSDGKAEELYESSEYYINIECKNHSDELTEFYEYYNNTRCYSITKDCTNTMAAIQDCIK